jgi:hypothetical protein
MLSRSNRAAVQTAAHSSTPVAAAPSLPILLHGSSTLEVGFGEAAPGSPEHEASRILAVVVVVARLFCETRVRWIFETS